LKKTFKTPWQILIFHGNPSGFRGVPWRFRSANQALQPSPVFQSLLREKSSEARGASAWDGLRLDLGSHGVFSS
jgi:hypothetical protein